MLIVVRNDHTASRKSLFLLRIAKLTDGKRRRNAHDTGRDESLWIDTQPNVTHQHTSSNGGKARAHHLMQFGLRKMWNERPDQHGRLALPDERRSSGDDSFSARYSHAPEEKDCELADEPLEDTPVIQELYERDEEYDGRDDTSEEPWQIRDCGIR